jgi:hypothetical protein
VDAWAERTLAEIETWDDLMPSDEKNARGLEKIRQLPVDTPEEVLKRASIPPKSQMRSRSWQWVFRETANNEMPMLTSVFRTAAWPLPKRSRSMLSSACRTAALCSSSG